MALYCLLIVLGFSFLSACGPKKLESVSPLDSAPNHYQRGLVRLDQGDLFTAQREFERARALDPGFAGAHVGNALVAMKQQDFWRARKDIEQAIHKDNDFIDAYIALGRIVTEEGVQRNFKIKDWLKEALSAYRKALRKDPDHTAVYFYQGVTYLSALDLEAALESFTYVLEQNRGPLIEKAMAEVEKIQMIQRAAPGSEISLKIALVPQISRAELAVLLLEELKLTDLVRQRPGLDRQTGFRTPQQGTNDNSAPVATDIAHSWAQPWIEEVLELGISGLEVFPDHTFQPEKPLTRANYALANQGVLMLLTGDSSLATRYIGEPSRFPDVRSDFYAYNAIALSTARGIMAADKVSGRFRPNEPVSGAEALVIIRELQNAFRMEF